MWRVLGCTICGHESKSDREAERHFNKRHRGTEGEECPVWVEFFKTVSKAKEKEILNECVCKV